MDFKFVYVNGHVEVLDNKGRFLFQQIRRQRPDMKSCSIMLKGVLR